MQLVDNALRSALYKVSIRCFYGLVLALQSLTLLLSFCSVINSPSAVFHNVKT